MSESFSIACELCREQLGIAQFSASRSRTRLYLDEDDVMRDFDSFLFKHIDHPLRFDGSHNNCFLGYRDAKSPQPKGRAMTPQHEEATRYVVCRTLDQGPGEATIIALAKGSIVIVVDDHAQATRFATQIREDGPAIEKP